MTTFKGRKTGFNTSGTNSCVPNEFGPSTTNFKGRGGVPSGKLQRHPGAVANISNSNRRLAKAAHGDGGGSGTSIRGTNAFTKKGR